MTGPIAEVQVSMDLDQNQINDIMQRFPSFELSYETVSHKKVSPDYKTCLAIPYGKKAFLWFTFFRDQNVCFLMELGRDKKKTISRVQVIDVDMPTKLAYGTVFYGSLTMSSDQSKFPVFVIEDVPFFQGIPLAKSTFAEKLGFLNQFFETHGPYVCQNMAITLPVMWAVVQDCSETIPVIPSSWQNHIPYSIHHFQYRALTTILPLINVPNNHPIMSANGSNGSNGPKNSMTKQSTNSTLAKQAPVFAENPACYFVPPALPRFDFSKPQYKQPTMFEVKADIQADIYHLYAFAKGSERVYCGLASIPNCGTSRLMNDLFRKIRENRNLDYIEESDDEEDFQDTRLDKYVDLSKTAVLECVFTQKFRRWLPRRIIPNRADYQGKVVHISRL